MRNVNAPKFFFKDRGRINLQFSSNIYFRGNNTNRFCARKIYIRNSQDTTYSKYIWGCVQGYYQYAAHTKLSSIKLFENVSFSFLRYFFCRIQLFFRRPSDSFTTWGGGLSWFQCITKPEIIKIIKSLGQNVVLTIT